MTHLQIQADQTYEDYQVEFILFDQWDKAAFLWIYS